MTRRFWGSLHSFYNPDYDLPPVLDGDAYSVKASYHHLLVVRNTVGYLQAMPSFVCVSIADTQSSVSRFVASGQSKAMTLKADTCL